MRIGRLNQRVIVERPLRTQDSAGAEEVAWSVVATVWGEVMPIKGRERMAANQLLAEMDTLIRLRWAPVIEAIDATWRLRVASVIYNIVSAANVQMANRELEVMCASGTNDG